MRNSALALGAGLIAVIYADYLFLVPIAAISILLAVAVTGSEGIELEEGAIHDTLAIVELVLLTIAAALHFWTVTIWLAILAAPIAAVLFVLSLGTVPYPPLPPRR